MAIELSLQIRDVQVRDAMPYTAHDITNDTAVRQSRMIGSPA
jgi:hypothetical protein